MQFEEERASANKNQMLVDRIDEVLNTNRHSSFAGDAESIDMDARSMVEGLSSPANQPFDVAAEEDDIIKTTRELLAQLKNDQAN